MIKKIIEGITRWQGFVSLLLTIQNIIMLDVIYNKVECSAFSFTREIRVWTAENTRGLICHNVKQALNLCTRAANRHKKGLIKFK